MNFIRRDNTRFSKLGKRRKKLQVWRSPKGRDNKLREKRKNRGALVSIGYRTPKTIRDKADDKKIMTVNNMKDFEKVQTHHAIIIGKVGKKKKLEMAKKAQEKKITVLNLNVRKFLKNNKEKGKK